MSCELRILVGLALVGVNEPINDCNAFLSCELCIDLTNRSVESSVVDTFSILFDRADTTDAVDKTSVALSFLGFIGDVTDEAEGKLVVDPVIEVLSDLIL